MCGIVGYVGPRSATPIVIEGLRRLEYRGYDSAGIAVVENGQVAVRRDVGKLSALDALLASQPVHGNIGLGHTRWATHGKPSLRNAHPHTDCSGEIVVIHNGIVENFLALRHELQAKGHIFRSDTDTEVIVHLVEEGMKAGYGLEEATREALRLIRGAHGIGLLSSREPDKIVVARIGNAGGVVIGVGQGEMFVASDVSAILEHTRDMIFLEDGQMAVVAAAGVRCSTVDGQAFEPRVVSIPWDPVSAAKGEYKHFMQKEIMEQARSVTDTIRGRVDFETGEVNLKDLNLPVEAVQSLDRVCTVACGTSSYAGLVGKFMIEELARLPVEVDFGSEFRYRDPIVDERTLVLAITQSGETVDTLAAMDEARSKGSRLVSIVNAIGTQAARVSDGVIYMHAGPEIGVASTKAFTASVVDQYMLALYLAAARGMLSPERMRELAAHLAELPNLVGRVLADGAPYQELAELYSKRQNFLYLGRGINYPIALEGALKLKEISYIHAEGYPAGEMKHGPIALIDESMPTVAIAVRDHVYDKMISQIEQVQSRGGKVLVVATEGDEAIARKADHVMYVPETSALLTPVLTVLPLQLLAYHIAVRRGCDVDQPRNLAKSVTVE
jgi:glucosamine--fructose-6-phosphate aminotransferase (isomerizing)